tara:strand:- start:368 stop:1084 length:717 start_codon:yes stop_codon:yes gene_type:complete
MCGIATILKKESFTVEEKLIFVKIMKESSIRGVHSFGFAYTEKGKIRNSKHHKIKNAIEFFMENIHEDFIYHNRYSTSGDWKNHNNNQPIMYKESSLVFNGVISMKEKAEMEKEYKIKMTQDNDGEIFLQNIENALQFVENNKLSFAGLFFKNKKIYALRNNLRPTWYSIKDKAVYIASTKDILLRSGLKKSYSTTPNKIYKMENFFEQRKGLYKLSYKNDEQWGYRPSEQLPALHCK